MFSIIITIPFSLAIIFCIIKKYNKRAIALVCISFLFSTGVTVTSEVENHYRERFYNGALKDISQELKDGNTEIVIEAIDETYKFPQGDTGNQIRRLIHSKKENKSSTNNQTPENEAR